MADIAWYGDEIRVIAHTTLFVGSFVSVAYILIINGYALGRSGTLSKWFLITVLIQCVQCFMSVVRLNHYEEGSYERDLIQYFIGITTNGIMYAQGILLTQLWAAATNRMSWLEPISFPTNKPKTSSTDPINGTDTIMPVPWYKRKCAVILSIIFFICALGILILGPVLGLYDAFRIWALAFLFLIFVWDVYFMFKCYFIFLKLPESMMVVGASSFNEAKKMYTIVIVSFVIELIAFALLRVDEEYLGSSRFLVAFCHVIIAIGWCYLDDIKCIRILDGKEDKTGGHGDGDSGDSGNTQQV